MSTGHNRYISQEYRTLVADSKAEGKIKGTARNVLTVLDARGVAVPEETRGQFLACTDAAQLATWLARAATASTISDVTGHTVSTVTAVPRPARRWRSLLGLSK